MIHGAHDLIEIDAGAEYKHTRFGLLDLAIQLCLGCGQSLLVVCDYSELALRLLLLDSELTLLLADVSPRELSYWSTAQGNWVLGTGQRQVLVGPSSRDIRVETSVNVRAR